MSLLVWRLSLLALALGRAVALPPFGNFARLSSYNRRDDDDFDPTDLSFITKMAAIGDSYSAGIGAGTALGTVVDVLTGQTKDGGKQSSPTMNHLYLKTQ